MVGIRQHLGTLIFIGWLFRIAMLPAQEFPSPAALHAFLCPGEKRPLSSWEHWLQHPPPARILLAPQPPDFSKTLLNTAPVLSDDDPFAETLRVFDAGVYQFGLSGAQGFNLRQWPRTWPELWRLLRLRNLLHLRDWIQPESNALRLQNLVGASFYFYF